MKPKSLKKILSEYLKGSNFKEINETLSLKNSWIKVVGKAISNNTEIMSIKNGKITIKTSNPIWRNELSLQKQDLFTKIKNAQPELNIKEIIFR